MCDFCKEKKFIPMGYRGEGIGTMFDNMRSLFGFGRHEEYESGSGIKIEEFDEGEYFLSYDNSADEYGDGLARIYYCPLCGEKL